MIQQLIQHIDLYYLCALLTLSYTLRDVGIAWLNKITKTSQRVYVVLIIAALLAIPFYVNNSHNECGMKLLLTYCVGTSLYEVFLKQFESIIKTILKIDKDA